MSDLHDMKVVVAGAGAFGAATSLALARAGAQVAHVAPISQSASSIAAGMLAPAFEAALDSLAADHFPLLRDARDLWPDFAEGLDVGLTPCGAEGRFSAERIELIAGRLNEIGARWEYRDNRLYTPEDWRLDACLALAALEDEGRRLGVQRIPDTALSATGTGLRLRDGSELTADAVVLATGYAGRGLVPELNALQPVRGQILRFPGAGPTAGPILRGEAYLVPHSSGAIVGATMEAGRADLEPDAQHVASLAAAAYALTPELEGRPFEIGVGVRPATPDGLPVVGRSVTGAWVANGARRNGWLLAPLVAQSLMAALAGVAVDPRLDLRRINAGGSSLER